MLVYYTVVLLCVIINVLIFDSRMRSMPEKAFFVFCLLQVVYFRLYEYQKLLSLNFNRQSEY